MAQITIQQGQGITQAIAQQIQTEGKTITNNDLSIWKQVMTEVKNGQEAENVYSGSENNKQKAYTGSDDIEQLNNRSNWRTDFKVVANQVITIAESVWNKIVQLLTGKKAEENLEVPEEKSVQEEEQPVEEEPVVPVEDESAAEEPAPVVQLEDLPKDAKIESRDIINIDNGDRKENIATTNKNGVKVYHEVVTDPTTGKYKMGRRLAVDGRGLKQNQYYAINNTIEDGAEVDTDTNINGMKNQLTYKIKDAQGKEHRYIMVKDENNLYGQGEELIRVGGSKKYLRQTLVNENVKKILNVKELPKDVEVRLVDDQNGGISYIFLKDGKKYNGEELMSLIRNENRDRNNISSLLKILGRQENQ